MRRIVLAIAGLAFFASSAAKQISAQNAAPQGQTTAVPPQTIDLATAKKMVAAAEASAVTLNQHVAICVMDTNGDVVLLERMDGVIHQAVITAEGKARAVLIFGVPTAQIADAVASKKPITVTITPLPSGAGGDATLQFRGGLPVMKDGKMIGSIGIGGSTSVQDEKFSQTGIDAISSK